MPLSTSELLRKIPSKIKDFTKLINNHEIMVARDYADNSYVHSFIAELSLSNHEMRVVEVSMTDLHNDSSIDIAKKSDVIVGTENKVDLRDDIKLLFSQAAARKSTDVHINVNSLTGGSLFYRIFGKRVFVRHYTPEDAIKFCSSLYNTVMDTGDISWQQTEYQAGSVRGKSFLPPSLYGIRVQSNPAADGFSMFLRLLSKKPVTINNLKHPFEELGFTKNGSLAMEDLTNAGQGLRLVIGSTGSGKSTTLKIVLELIARMHTWKNQLTIEDPPEYPIEGAIQFMVANSIDAEDRKQKFNEAFRAAMRSDPDLIMVGEIRDATTAHLAWECSLSGHETWSTMHANDAVDATERLIEEMGIHPRQVGNLNVLRGLISQALVPVMCPHCKVALKDSKDHEDVNFHEEIDKDKAFVSSEKGCERCNYLGSNGLRLLTDITLPDLEFCARVQARDAESARAYLFKKWKGRGLLGIDQALDLVNLGFVDPIEASQKAIASGLVKGRF
jgi:general secretion pathway protein E